MTGSPYVLQHATQHAIDQLRGQQIREPNESSNDDVVVVEDSSCSWKEAEASLGRFIKFEQCKNSYNALEIADLKVIQKDFHTKREMVLKQKDIRTMF